MSSIGTRQPIASREPIPITILLDTCGFKNLVLEMQKIGTPTGPYKGLEGPSEVESVEKNKGNYLRLNPGGRDEPSSELVPMVHESPACRTGRSLLDFLSCSRSIEGTLDGFSLLPHEGRERIGKTVRIRRGAAAVIGQAPGPREPLREVLSRTRRGKAVRGRYEP
jgi:hypothetical protein